MGRIVIYSIVGCKHCKAAKQRLQDEALAYVDVSVDRFPTYVRDWVRQRTGKTSVPQIFFNNTYIGGNKELQDLLDNTEERVLALDKLEKEELVEDESSPVMPHPSEVIETPTVDTEFNCEKDKLGELVEKLEKSDLLKTHRKGLFNSVPNSFTGAELTEFLKTQDTKEYKDEDLGQALINSKYVLSVSRTEVEIVPTSLYTLSHLSTKPGVLNAGEMADYKVGPADQMARDIRNVILELFSSFLSHDGKSVDYKGMGESPLWLKFKKMAIQLQRVNLDHISADHKVAFFINIYNVLVIHGTVENGVPNGLVQRYKFFAHTAYNIGGHELSLNDIENGILRSNRSSMATLYRTPFSKSDPKLKLSLELVEPRIHFALNCGAKSCPPIKTFSGDEIQDQLELATNAFLENDDALQVDVAKDLVKLSQLFKWYAVDFGNNKDEVLSWVLSHTTEPERKAALEEVIKKGPVKVAYLPYDWGDNSSSKE